MSDITPEADHTVVAALTAEFPDGDIGEAGAYTIDNGTLLDAIRLVRQIGKDLQLRSIDDRDPTLALRAHEVQGIGKTILERLLIAQGGQGALDELNNVERTANQNGTTTIWPR